MPLLDYFGKKTASVTNQITQQAKMHSDISRLQGLIAEQEKMIQILHLKIGKAYADAHREDPEPEFADAIAKVLQAEACIDDFRNQIRACKGMTLCKACGAEVPQDTAFCSSCGARMEVPAGYVVCENCGARMEKGLNFCTECGTQLAKPESPETAPRLCPNCQIEVPKDANFCSSCGTAIPKETPKPAAMRTCTHCGAEAKPEDLFCTKCGKPLTQAPPAAQTILVQEVSIPRRCPDCGAELAEDVLFCTECGKRM